MAKDEGNEYFRLCKFEEAVRSYTRGINHDPESSSMHVLYANRAMAYLKLLLWDLAMAMAVAVAMAVAERMGW